MAGSSTSSSSTSAQQAVSLDANRKGALYATRNLLRLMREGKQHLGYQLTDGERRAGRHWWPFGDRSKPARLQAQPALVRPSLRIAGLVVLAILLRNRRRPPGGAS